MERLRDALLILSFLLVSYSASEEIPAAVEFCLQGQADLGVRLQGLQHNDPEFYPARFCITTTADTGQVHFVASGNSNPDMADTFAVTYLPPSVLRIVRRASPPDVEFSGKSVINEALRHARIDPYRLVAEIRAHPDWIQSVDDGWLSVRYPDSTTDTKIRVVDGKLRSLRLTANLPLRGRVPVAWDWQWPDEGEPKLTQSVDGEVYFRATGSRRPLSAEAADNLWQLSGGQDPRPVPGEHWPARIDMKLTTLADGVYLVTGVRTGFHHLVVDTTQGLVVADAPAGWVELHQIPPTDLVPGLGISGLSERFIDFLQAELAGRPIRAVALTHAHDDHAGGARAFAAAGADVYAPAEVRAYLAAALNRDAMPDDRLRATGDIVEVLPVSGQVALYDEVNRVQLMNIGPGPHVAASLGVWAVDAGFFFQSDLHVPNSEKAVPRPDRAATECWFAAWAVEHLPAGTIVINTHSLIRSPVSRLADYLHEKACKQP